MKSRILFIIALSMVLMASNCRKENKECENGHYSFEFYNNSNNRLNREFYWDSYPDTAIGEYNPTGFGIIEPHTKVAISSSVKMEKCWEQQLKDGKKQYLFIFDEDSLEAIPWETVRATNRGLLERREISLKYLQDNNWTVTYP